MPIKFGRRFGTPISAKLGLKKVHLCIQSISTLRPGHFAQLLAMGADTIHPALLLDPRVFQPDGKSETKNMKPMFCRVVTRA